LETGFKQAQGPEVKPQYFKKKKLIHRHLNKVGMVAHMCNPGLRRLKWEDPEFQTSWATK
jgi:hypothetical protein